MRQDALAMLLDPTSLPHKYKRNKFLPTDLSTLINYERSQTNLNYKDIPLSPLKTL